MCCESWRIASLIYTVQKHKIQQKLEALGIWGSAYLHQGTPYQCRDISSASSESVRDRHRNLINSPIANPWKLHVNPFGSFCAKLLTNKQKKRWKHNLLIGGNKETRMWANAQRDGRPTEHRWCPLFNATKFGSCPVLDCRAVTLPRRESRWNQLGCPKLPDRSQPLVGRSLPYCGEIWRTHCCLTIFFPIIDMCLICEDIARQSCTMVRRWRFLARFCVV